MITRQQAYELLLDIPTSQRAVEIKKSYGIECDGKITVDLIDQVWAIEQANEVK